MPGSSYIVRLNVRQRGEYMSAICADVPGLHIYGKSMESLRRSAMAAIPRLLKSNKHLDVEVSPTDDLAEIRIRPV